MRTQEQNQFKRVQSQLRQQIFKLKQQLRSVYSLNSNYIDISHQLQIQVSEKRLLQHKLKKLQIKTKDLEEQIKRQKNKQFAHYESKLEVDKKRFNKGDKPKLQIIEEIQKQNKPITFVNSELERINTLKPIEELKLFYTNNHINKEYQLITQNNKLKQWLKNFIESIERILKIRLQKLRQSGQSEQQIFIKYHYMNRMHLNIVYSFEQDQFPFVDMLYDFQTVVKQADDYKIKSQRLQILNEAKLLERELVTKVIDTLANYHSIIIQEFSQAGKKRKALAEEYRKMNNFDQDTINLISELTVNKIKQFLNHPQRILNEIQKQFEDLRKNKTKVIEQNQYIEPQFVQNRKKLSQQIQNYLQSNRDKKLVDDQMEKFINKKKNIEHQNTQQNINQDLITCQENEIEISDYYQKAQLFIQKKYKQLAIKQTQLKIQQQLKEGKDPELVKNQFYQSLLYGTDFQVQKINLSQDSHQNQESSHENKFLYNESLLQKRNEPQEFDI